MTSQTFTFLLSESDSDVGDDTRLIKDKGQGHSIKSVGFKTHVTEEFNNNINASNTKQNGHLKSVKKQKKPRKKRTKSANQIQSVDDGLKQLEKHEFAKKRRQTLFQLMAVSAVAMLHGLSIIPFFWNSMLLNVYDLTTQTVCLWVILVSYLLSCVISPVIIPRMSVKLTLVCGCLTASLFTAARFFPKIYLIAPAALIMGITLAPFYTTVFRQICNLSIQYEGYQGRCYKDNIYTFTAVCYGWISCSPVWLSMLHIFIYNIVGGHGDQAVSFTSEDCGFSYLWDWSSQSGETGGLSPEVHSIQALLGSCLVCTLGGVLLTVVAVDNHSVPDHRTPGDGQEKLGDHVADSVQQLRDSNYLLMFPIFFAVGAMEVFCYTLYGQAFVSCTFGSDSLYHTVLCMSVTAGLASVAAGLLSRRITSVKVIVPVYLITLALLLVMMFIGYLPYTMHFINAALLGILNYILTTQVAALLLLHSSTCLPVSHALMQFARGLAFLAAFILVRYQGDNSTLMVAVIGSVFIGCFCHVILEIRLRLLERSEKGDVDRSGAYVLLGKAPWIPEFDPTSLNLGETERLLTRLPGAMEEQQCNQQ